MIVRVRRTMIESMVVARPLVRLVLAEAYTVITWAKRYALRVRLGVCGSTPPLLTFRRGTHESLSHKRGEDDDAAASDDDDDDDDGDDGDDDVDGIDDVVADGMTMTLMPMPLL